MPFMSTIADGTTMTMTSNATSSVDIRLSIRDICCPSEGVARALA